MAWTPKGNARTAILLLAVVALTAFGSARQFMSMWEMDTVVPAPGFQEHKLSEWFDGIKDTPADTPVYIQEGPEPGGTVFVMGGTHPNEPASSLTAVLFLERAKVEKGRLIVVPFANLMAFTHNSPQEAHPQYIHFTVSDGSVRTFRYGSRATNPIFQWPDPDVYIHPQSGQELAGSERSNLNRAHPGTPDGALTQRLAYALRQLVIEEKVDLAFDLHEASPEYPVVNAIVAHERSIELAAMVAMEMEIAGIPIRLEPSPKNLRGLTHREWGDYTDTMPILMETGNPSQGRLRGRTNEALVLTGEDKYYEWASKLGLLFIPYEKDQPIELRIARHTASLMSFFEALGFFDPSKEVIVSGIPGFEELTEKGLGPFLAPVE
ncbi:MAG: succinylglutamate desuccinylase/aspartoacylase family protein [Thermovirgaceae bacterium]